jgi:acetolactate synthase regulatory subunit
MNYNDIDATIALWRLGVVARNQPETAGRVFESLRGRQFRAKSIAGSRRRVFGLHSLFDPS